MNAQTNDNAQNSVVDEKRKHLLDLVDKYLTFMLADEEYAVQILKVKEIIGVIEITTVPQTTDFMLGVINLRGKVIPIVDLRLRFGLEYREHDERTCIIVMEILSADGTWALMGILVDSVSEVINVAQDELEPAPIFGVDLDISYILGIAKVGDNVKVILDIDKVLGEQQLVV